MRSKRLVLLSFVALCLPIAAGSQDTKPPLSKYQDVFPDDSAPSSVRMRYGGERTSPGAPPLSKYQDVMPVGGSYFSYPSDHLIFVPQGRRATRPTTTCVTSALALPSVHMVWDLATELELTDEQLRTVISALDTTEGMVKSLRARASNAAAAARKALLDPSRSAASVKTSVDAARRAEADVAAVELQAWMDLRTMLDANQLKKLGEAMTRQPSVGDGLTPKVVKPSQKE